MPDSLSDPTIRIFPLLIGIMAIVLAVLDKRLYRWIGRKPLSEVITNPRYQRSAGITEKLGRLFLVFFGIGFIVESLGPRFLPAEVHSVVSLVILGLTGLIVLAIIGVNLAHWERK